MGIHEVSFYTTLCLKMLKIRIGSVQQRVDQPGLFVAALPFQKNKLNNYKNHTS
jgi:hypothetical protein